MVWHQYNIRPKQELAYYCTKTGKLSLAANVNTIIEVNAGVDLVTGVSQEYRHIITGDKKSHGRDLSPINWDNLTKVSGL